MIYVRDKEGNVASKIAVVPKTENNNAIPATNNSNNGSSSYESTGNKTKTENKSAGNVKDTTTSKESFGQYGDKMIIGTVIIAVAIIGAIMYRKSKKYEYK